ncbi:hypothetical protein PEX1_041720 [Penicillium expansum]|uniref:Uncharacterized protein n=1 Tax=Penicillium expansum TaxID=27334 RepID=A0A0A2IV66_PENEN|nr:hypothetical protein PEX2_093120 [Penicillium expansum]KGO46959.1 hypothetical protein PEXP_063570 [Penicillium expansum]KGO58957.1 hypothetical protein PEX2_093120 [Penicillium expansum]KGO70143.1 hypothetical protein PEX1_041720 [Penicillium expansum]
MRSIILGTSISLLYAVSVAAVPHSSRVKTSSAQPSATPAFTIKNLGVTVDTTSSPWKDAQCTTNITDATLDPTARWDAANADDALNDALSAWSTSGAASGLGFPEFISNYFTGPDNWNCGDIGNTPCSTVMTCNQADYPAGYLIMNSFSSIHQLHQQTYDALGDALNTMQNDIGSFASIFAPQAKDDSEIVKYIIDAVILVATIGSSFAWNIAFKGLAMAASKYFSMGKDVTNAALISFASAIGKDSMKSAKDALSTQNSVSAALGVYFSAWTGLESGYMTSLFGGASDNTSIDALKTLASNGSMLLLSSKVNLSGLTAQAEKILYGQLIPAAWAISPETTYPRILRKAGACSTSIDADVSLYMSESTLVGGYVCYNNDAFYVVSINTSPGMQPFEALPGGNHQTLNGDNWGGVILEDIVQSSYQAYQLNGNANGYEMPALSKIIDGSGTEGDVVFENGIRTPGFFTLPICDDIPTAADTVSAGGAKGKYWPCDAPAGYNAAGTNVHVNNGCINVDGESLCKSQTKYTNIADQSTGDITATIYAQFNGEDKTDYKVTPGCKLQATWPRSYGDVYFGANNCLYDSTGTNINGQCCTEATTDSILNPYYGY